MICLHSGPTADFPVKPESQADELDGLGAVFRASKLNCALHLRSVCLLTIAFHVPEAVR